MKHVLQIILILLVLPAFVWAEQVTYTVAAYNKVTTSGDVPLNSSATFYCGSKRGSAVYGGDTATLSVAGLAGCTITGLSLSMHSNTKAGSGSLTMKCGGVELASIADATFADASWHGAYTSDFVEIHPAVTAYTVSGTEVLTVSIIGSANSLYVGEYTISYSLTPTQRYSVAFQTNSAVRVSDMVEPSPGEGIVLPMCDCNVPEWAFLGWGESPCSSTTTAPEYMTAGAIYHPKGNTTLYALYSNVKEQQFVQDTTLTDGLYLFASALYGVLAISPVENGRMNAMSISELPAASLVYDSTTTVYTLRAADVPFRACYSLFFEDSTVYVQYAMDASSIGYKRGVLSNADAGWRLRTGRQHQLAFSDDTGKILAPTLGGTVNDTTAYFSLLSLDYKPTSSYIVLLRCPDDYLTYQAMYSSWPGGNGVEENKDRLFTVENMWVRNLKGELLKLYDMQGRCVCVIHEDLCLIGLPRGTYVISSELQTEKIFIP